MKRKHANSNTRRAPDWRKAPGSFASESLPDSRASRVRFVWLVSLTLAASAVLVLVGLVVLRGRPQAEPTLLPVQSSTKSAAAVPGTEARHSSKEDAAQIERINKANHLLADNKPAEALPLLKEALALKPEDEDVHYNLGITLARLGKNDEAVKEYEEALRLFPDYAEAHNNLGNLLLRTGHRDDAIKHFEQAVKITPDYAAALNNLGNAWQQAGQTNQAREFYERAAKADTNYWQARFNLGTSYAQQRRFTEARAEFQSVLRAQPDFAPAKQALARIDTLNDNAPHGSP